MSKIWYNTMMLTNRKTIIGIFAGLTLGAIMHISGGESLFIESALAQSSVIGGGSGTSNVFSTTANAAVILLSFMHFLSFLIIYLLQALLDPGFLNNVMTGSLRDIWIFSRDLMNVIFAFMLVGAGIFTVVTGNKEVVQSKYKRFILAIILVNFSWFFPRLIIDVANVLTATIYQIPAGMQVRDSTGAVKPMNCEYTDANNNKKPCRAITKMKLGQKCKDHIAGTASPPDPDDYTGYVANVVCVHYEDIGTPGGPGQYTSAGMLNGLVLGYGRLSSLPLVLNPNSGPAGATTEMERLTSYFFFLMHILLVVGLMAMLFLPLLAMLVVFIIRIPIIWFTVAFMPFMFIGFVADDKITPGFNTFEIFKKFAKAAFLPVALAVPMCIGFILLSTVGTQDCVLTLGADNPLCINTGAMVSGINDAWSLLWLLMTFLVIWTGFFAAMKIDETYVNVTNGIKNFGSSIGTAALKIPMSIPIPTGAGKSMTLNQMKNEPRAFSNRLDNLSFGDALKGGSSSSSSGNSGNSKVVDALKDSQSPMNKALATIAHNSQIKGYDKSTGKITNMVDFKADLKTQMDSGALQSALQTQGLSQEEAQSFKPEDVLKNLDQHEKNISEALKKQIDTSGGPPNNTP